MVVFEGVMYDTQRDQEYCKVGLATVDLEAILTFVSKLRALVGLPEHFVVDTVLCESVSMINTSQVLLRARI